MSETKSMGFFQKFLKTPELLTLTGDILLYGKKFNTLPVRSVAIANILALPSFQRLPPEAHFPITLEANQGNFFSALGNALNDLRKTYGKGELIFGLGFLTLAQIAVISTADFLLHAVGAILARPAVWLTECIRDNKVSVPAKFLCGLILPVAALFWTLGQAFSFGADTLSYTRQFIDCMVGHFLNGYWWTGKTGTTTASFETVARNFLSSALNLIPATLVILTGVFTAGFSIPALQWLAGPLNTFGSAIVGSITHAASSAAASVAAGIGANILAGTVMTYLAASVSTLATVVSRVFSGFVRTGARYWKEKETEKRDALRLMQDGIDPYPEKDRYNPLGYGEGTLQDFRHQGVDVTAEVNNYDVLISDGRNQSTIFNRLGIPPTPPAPTRSERLNTMTQEEADNLRAKRVDPVRTSINSDAPSPDVRSSHDAPRPRTLTR